ncbi:MAG: signal peptide peptidase SppA, partial [Planctomycetes bacterium]|nr:signal peptide peptidase SppA [Planctomycetota bacterium]
HRVRGSGKKVYAQLESAMGAQYVLATACDEIVMPEAGMILIPGIHAEMGYYKDMLEKIGIEADMLHVGAAKGAAEPFTRRSMSEPVKKNMTALVDDLFDQMITKIASNRGLRIDEVRALVDKGMLRPNEAKQAGLIDRVAYPDALRESLSEEYDADKLVYVMNYAKKKIDTDFSGPMGMIKLFQAILGVSRGDGSDKGPKIAVVYAVGPIMSGKSQNDPFSGQIMGSDTIVEALQDAADDENVKAIVLRVNSPGGSALASDLIWRATQTIEKPIVASMGDVAASGGYYISMGADRIVAEPGTITGSIGVVGGKFNMSGLYGKIGITTDVISRGKNSGMFSSTTNFSDSERQVVSDMMHDVYRLFTTKAAEGRKMSLEKLEALAGGQIYTGRVAKRNGLVDQLGTLKDAIQLAKQLAGLDPDEKVKLKVLPEPQNPFDAIFDVASDAEKEVRLLGSLRHLLPELTEPLRRAANVQRIMRDPVALMMPFWIEIK